MLDLVVKANQAERTERSLIHIYDHSKASPLHSAAGEFLLFLTLHLQHSNVLNFFFKLMVRMVVWSICLRMVQILVHRIPSAGHLFISRLRTASSLASPC